VTYQLLSGCSHWVALAQSEEPLRRYPLQGFNTLVTNWCQQFTGNGPDLNLATGWRAAAPRVNGRCSQRRSGICRLMDEREWEADIDLSGSLADLQVQRADPVAIWMARGRYYPAHWTPPCL